MQTVLLLSFSLTGGYDVQFLQRTKASPLELARKRFPRPSASELNEALANSLSFLIVREPFERLLSGYRNKLESRRNKYYKLLGDQIIKDHRKGNKRVSHFRILSLIALRNSFDVRKVTNYDICNLCHVFMPSWILESFFVSFICYRYRNRLDQVSKNLFCF